MVAVYVPPDLQVFAEQADFVDMIRDGTSYDRLRIRKNPVVATVLDVVVDNGARYVTYDFRPDANDDLRLLNAGYAGAPGNSLAEKQNYASRTGAWVMPNANHYTTQIGATFTGTITGEEIRFVSYADNRGGLWSFSVDGGAPVELSTWSASPVNYNIQVVVTGLTNTLHTVVGTFMGDDPAHAPTGGTARGWVWYTSDPPPYAAHATYESYAVFFPAQQAAGGTICLAPTSNKEGAFTFTVDGHSHWFPEHSGVGTAFAAEPTRFLLDGAEVDFSAMVAGEFQEGSEFQLVQHVYCQFPEVAGNIAELTMTHTVGMDGVVHIDADLTYLQDCTVVVGYPLMLPVSNSVLNEFVTGIGTRLVNPADDSYTYFADDRDLVYSVAGISSASPDYIAAMSVDHIHDSLRIGKAGKPEIGQSLMAWGRALTLKGYHCAYDDTAIVAADPTINRHRYSGRFAAGWIEGIYATIGGM